jgi:hypothetical protein
MADRDVGLDAVAVTVDPSVRAENAFVLADLEGAPVFIGRTVGRGRAILLNFNLGQAIGSAADPQSALRFVEALLATAHVAPRFRVEPPGVWEVRALQYGDATLVGLLREMPGSAALVLPEPAEAYDVRAGKGLGRLSSISLSADDARDVLVFALLKAAPEGMALDVSDAAPGGAAEGKLSLKGGPSGSIVRLRVRDPAGNEVRVLRRYLRCEQGQAAFEIPIAFNDQPGRWVVSAADVATGISRETTFRVRKGARER